MNKSVLYAVVVVFFMTVPSVSAGAVVQEFQDKLAWESAVGDFTTITFTEFPFNTLITDQYAPLGVHFLGGNDFIWESNAYPNDKFGLNSPDIIQLTLDTPQTWLALEHPGIMQIQLFRDSVMIYDSGIQIFGGSGIGFFSGVLSDQTFDEVLIIDWFFFDSTIDDLHFGGGNPGDLDSDLFVGVMDLLSLLGAWGQCPAPCAPTCFGDINHDCTVGEMDLLLLIDNWGECQGCLPIGLGACCMSDGTCLELLETDCAATGGEHYEPGVFCEHAICPPTGACCQPDGSCLDLTELACSIIVNSTFQGAFTQCVNVICPVTITGACCVAGDFCVVVLETSCVGVGGTFQGDETGCKPNPCP